ncbi:division plane positioning ATPase MipZ [Tsuneonella mangrovi]|uniref:division plane positioning ATPase MipZ n=1 Tax=Tsuneonella mangrovi TaxID=1982042 RepID=UPI000BA219FE|nr:division plane positioning ATPase MipZ [Tsuneonella mangrovi]
MKPDDFAERAGIGREPYTNGESPSRVLDEIDRHRNPHGHVVTFANEKGGVGKTTMAFHTCVALASRGMSVLAIDLDARQGSLARTLETRQATARCLGTRLPEVRACRIESNCSAIVQQEIARLGSGCDVIVIDAPGRDLPIVRRAIAIADTLVTPINASYFDLDGLGHFDPVTRRLREPSAFTRTVIDLREEQARRDIALADWVVAKNRVRTAETAQLARIDAAIAQLSGAYGIRVVDGLRERVAYRGLLQFGLATTDLKHLPQLSNTRTGDSREIARLVDSFDLPHKPGHPVEAAAERRVRIQGRTRANYVKALQEFLTPQRVEAPRKAAAVG